MVNLSARAAAVAAGLILAGSVAVAPLAFAADTGPGSADCLTAQATVKIRVDAAAQASVAFENAASGLDPAAKAKIAAAVDAFDAAKAKLDDALAKLKAAPTDANKDVADKAGVAVTAAAQALIDATPDGLAGAKQALINARIALEAALAVQDKACDGPTPTATPTPTPTVTVSPTPTAVPPLYADCDAARAAGKAPIALDQPGYRAALDSDGDGLACESVEGTVPTVIDTGYAA